MRVLAGFLITLGEPDAKLFAPPEGYTVKELPVRTATP
jgi:hypothetical protein